MRLKEVLQAKGQMTRFQDKKVYILSIDVFVWSLRSVPKSASACEIATIYPMVQEARRVSSQVAGVARIRLS